MAHDRWTGPEEREELERFCHDLRQHVAAGLLLADLPQERLPGELRQRLGLIRQQFEEIGAMVASVLGDTPPDRRPVDLVDLADQCVGLALLTHEVRIDLETHGRPVASGDGVLLRRALLNVLDNACRAAGRDGRVRVRVGSSGDSWVEVSDDGPGFGQIERGSGHGLAALGAAVHAGRGRLEVVTGPEDGTTVRIVLPRHPVEAAAG